MEFPFVLIYHLHQPRINPKATARRKTQEAEELNIDPQS